MRIFTLEPEGYLRYKFGYDSVRDEIYVSFTGQDGMDMIYFDEELLKEFIRYAKKAGYKLDE